MQKSDLPSFFESLHRPFHQPLKSTKWVCEFIRTRKNKIKNSELNLEFYIYLINKLRHAYHADEYVDLPGLPSKFAIDSVYNSFSQNSKSEKKKIISAILRKDRETEIEKQIYSTYKAASYYVNLTKDKFKLVDSTNTLTEFGENLMSIKSRNHLTNLSAGERKFYFCRIVENDFLLILSLCFFKRIEFKYNLSDIENEYFDFIDKMYHIKHFRYNKQSLSNYNKVRSFWISNIQLLNSRNQVKKGFLDIIKNDFHLNKWLKNVEENFKIYENENFKKIRNHQSIKDKFTENYLQCLRDKKDVQGFVNLYDIKANMKISHENFEKFINAFYELEKAKSHIFFSNIVASIDRRKRFIVRGVPVLKIKYKS